MIDTENETKRSAVLNKILQHPAAAQERESDESNQYEDARSRDNLNLELRFRNGKRSFFSLVELGQTDFEPGDADIITLRFNRADVIVTGQGLEKLYEKLLDQKARFIQQHTEAEGDLLRSKGPYVVTIDVRRKED